MQIKLVGASGYVLPLSKRLINKNQTLEITDIEWQKVKNTGLFFVVSEEDASSPNGFSYANDVDVKRHLPNDWSNSAIIVKILGGIGDTLIVGCLGKLLKEKECFVTLAVSEEWIPLAKCFNYFDAVISITEANSLEVLRDHNYLLDLTYAYHEGRDFAVKKDFYKQIVEKAGLPPRSSIPTVEIKFPWEVENKIAKEFPKGVTFVLHTGSSNPIRRWKYSYWERLAQKLLENNANVIWLGLDSDFCLYEENSYSYLGRNLLEQAVVASMATFFIGNDSGFAHLAGCCERPGLVLLGSTDEEAILSQYNTLSGIKTISSLECIPCRSLRNDCPLDVACMTNLSPEEVINKLSPRLLEEARRTNRPKVKKKKNLFVRAKQKVRVSRLDKFNKILFVIPSFGMGGGQRVVLSLVKELVSSFQIDVASLVDLKSDNFLKENFKKTINGKIFENECEKLKTLIRESDYDCILYSEFDNNLTNFFMKLETRPSTIRIFHTNNPRENNIEECREGIDRLICVNKKVANELRGKYIPNGVDTTNFKNDPKWDITFNNDYPVLGYFGRMDSMKGIYDVLQYVEHLDINILLVGVKKSEFSTLEKRIGHHNLKDRVKLVSTSDSLEGAYKVIDAFVLLSKTEGFPLSVFEAAHNEIPTIATEVGCLPEIFENDVNIVFCENNLPSFKKAVEKIKIQGKEIGRLAKKISSFYNNKKTAKEYKKEILKVLGEAYPAEIRKGRIVVERIHGAGDVLMATALVRKLRIAFPEAKLIFRTQDYMKCLVENNPDVSDIMSMNDGSLLVKADYYGCWNETNHACESMGGSKEDLYLGFPKKLKSFKKRNKSIGMWPFANPGSRKSAEIKEWADENWLELNAYLSDKGYTCYQLGWTGERQLPFLTDLRKETILEALGTLREVDYIITINGVVGPACKALGLKPIILWGGASKIWMTGYDNSIDIISPTEYSCVASADFSKLGTGNCCGGSGKCMAEISVDQVMDAFERLKNA